MKRNMKRGCRRMLEDLQDVRKRAQELRLFVCVSEVTCGKRRRTLHVMFEWAGKRILDYWPGSGRTYCRRTHEKDRVGDCFEALEMAHRLKQDCFEIPAVLPPSEE